MNAAAVCECLSGSVRISLVARDFKSQKFFYRRYCK